MNSFREHFQQADKEERNVRLKGEALLGELTIMVFMEMEDDVQRSFNPTHFPSALGEDFIVQRRENSARILAKKLTNGAKRQIELETYYHSWCRWENYGYNICAYGWIFYALIAMISIFLAWRPFLIAMNNFNYSIVFFLILAPIILAGLCYLIASRYKQRFVDLKIDKDKERY